MKKNDAANASAKNSVPEKTNSRFVGIITRRYVAYDGTVWLKSEDRNEYNEGLK